MEKIYAAAAGALLVVCAGCYSTNLAQPPVSQEEKAWEELIRESYPGYRAPQKISRTVKGHTEKRVSAVISETPVKPLDDPAEVKADKAADAPVELEKPAAEPAANKDGKADAPALTDNPTVAEVKTDKPAVEEVKPAENAEKSAAEVKPAENAEKSAAEVKPAENAEAPAAEVKPAAKVESTPPDPTNSTVYVVKSGDTLGGIAQKTYGSASYSNVIFKANSDILKDPNKLRPGMKLIVPKL